MKLNTVCIIDDDPIFVYGTKVLLNYNSSLYSNIIVFENGKEALDDLRFMLNTNKELPEIIFLDLNMPIMNGWEFLDELKAMDLKNKIGVYIVTSSIDRVDEERSKKYDMVIDFISKPLTTNKLQQLLVTTEDRSL
ncbi:response regulator [Flavobacteriaceae bacterium KMM 6897]|nr:response regulator [Flavobacteriaceae bacterium KMM 6897]MEB8347485.1 response regulator [Flavobacteriaceae bacterium KMM 6898]